MLCLFTAVSISIWILSCLRQVIVSAKSLCFGALHLPHSSDYFSVYSPRQIWFKIILVCLSHCSRSWDDWTIVLFWEAALSEIYIDVSNTACKKKAIACCVVCRFCNRVQLFWVFLSFAIIVQTVFCGIFWYFDKLFSQCVWNNTGICMHMKTLTANSAVRWYRQVNLTEADTHTVAVYCRSVNGQIDKLTLLLRCCWVAAHREDDQARWKTM